MTISLGDILWTAKSSIESAGYGEDFTAPHRVKVHKIDFDGRCIRASAFDPETGEIDDDSNATVYCFPEELFVSEADAQKVYLDELERKLKILTQQCEQARRRYITLLHPRATGYQQTETERQAELDAAERSGKEVFHGPQR